MEGQISMLEAEETEEYRAFVEKFKPKKTTDDCYTPPLVYDAVADWVAGEYGVSRESFVRPFWPGGDYERFEYPEGCVVVDNPPFSILAKIIRFYMERGIRFFLFAQYKTLMHYTRYDGVCVMPCDTKITYENGAVVNTGFVTNMDSCMARSAPGLFRAVNAAVEACKKSNQPPVYVYPDHILTFSQLGYMGKHGVDFRVERGCAVRVGALDAQRPHGKGIYGSWLLISDECAARKVAAYMTAAEKAAAEKAAAEKAILRKENATFWALSEREREIVRTLK